MRSELALGLSIITIFVVAAVVGAIWITSFLGLK